MKIKMYQCGGEKGFSEYPIGLGYLKTNITGHDVEIVQDKRELGDCDIVGLSTNAWGIREAWDITAGAHASGQRVVLGGQGTLWEGVTNLSFDWVVLGEGERALQNILDGEIEQHCTHKMPNITDIDSIKPPARGKCGPIVPVISSRGCPYNCHFCSATSFWGKVRFHSPEYFMAEVEQILVDHPQTKEVYMLDDLFLAPKKRFQDIYELWMKKGWDKRLAIRGWVRADLLTLEVAQQMKRMGFLNIRFGVESGSDRMLKLMNKGITVAQNQRAIDIARQVGLPLNLSWMRGLPGETVEDRRLTAAFMQRNNIPLSYVFKAWPGCKFYEGEDMLSADMRCR